MTTLRQTATLIAHLIRAFIRDPAAVIAMVGHHLLGDRDRAAELAERVKKAGQRRDER